MKTLLLLITSQFLISNALAQNNTKLTVNTVIESWHKAAADADFNSYFDLLSDDALFIGTDATENWTKLAFQTYAKPHFDKGKAWNFTAIERHIYINGDHTIAWFDELLNTQMKICRGSGVLVLENGKWKIKHYVLSMTVPNEVSDEVVKIKSPTEDALIASYENKK